ncbi:MAG: phosphatase PAP2 family protein [Kiritimatiellae bacterium]|nr:phosphatase PAP2 family protein [Kiritimatiellia bacterium]MDD4736726.1 phosphatase PAP2 family protein [Kiritimatiellia bacterium]
MFDWKGWWTDIDQLIRMIRPILRSHRWFFILTALLGGLATVSAFPYDQAVTHLAEADWHIPFWWYYAGELSHYGAFERGTLLLVALLLIGGWIKNKIEWRRVAIACLLACLFSGIIVNTLKCSIGRPRPNAGVEQDGFYGPTLDNDFKSFASAHATTAIATATCLSIVFPSLAVPLYVFEGAVSLSRIYVKGHYLSDVLAGAFIGLWFGALMGLACRRLNREELDTYPSPPH